MDGIRRGLGIFVTSTERGSNAPQLAQMIAGQVATPVTLSARLSQLDSSLVAATSIPEILNLVTQVPDAIGLTRGVRAWARSAVILRALLGPRLCRAATFPQSGFDFLRARLTDRQVSLLTYSDVDDPADIQLMGLYQSKGREADATIVVLRGNDYFGMESEPMPVGSKLLYVALTRARTKTIVLTLGSTLPSLIYPLAVLSAGS
jgi:DNA helicase II / ATP-dependent DNA helicase PcrA